MIPRLVPEISPYDAFCDEERRGARIGYSRSYIAMSKTPLVDFQKVIEELKWENLKKDFLGLRLQLSGCVH